MKAAILGLGESLNHFDGEGVTFGVNEIFKHHPVDYLVLMNPPNRHTLEEIEIIKNSKPKHVVTYYPFSWLQYWMPQSNVDKIRPSLKHKEVFFQDGRRIRISPWNDKFVLDRIYYSITSPFVAISLAAYLGFDEIILWGVDLRTHASYPVGSNGHSMETERYKALSDALKLQGISVRHGVENFSYLNL